MLFVCVCVFQTTLCICVLSTCFRRSPQCVSDGPVCVFQTTLCICVLATCFRQSCCVFHTTLSICVLSTCLIRSSQCVSDGPVLCVLGHTVWMCSVDVFQTVLSMCSTPHCVYVFCRRVFRRSCGCVLSTCFRRSCLCSTPHCMFVFCRHVLDGPVYVFWRRV